MKRVLSILVLGTLLASREAAATDWCKVEDADLGKVGLTLTFGGSKVTFVEWIAKGDAPGEYVGFRLSVEGETVLFWVKAGEEFFRGEDVSWTNPYGLSGPLARGISHIDFCENPPIDPNPTTTTTSTTLGGVDIVTTTTSTTTTTTLPSCGVIPILEDPTKVEWSEGQSSFFTHGRLIPTGVVDYPLTALRVELETVPAGVWHAAGCDLTQVSASKWKCRPSTSGVKGFVKIKPYRRTGEMAYAYKLRQRGASIAAPPSLLIKINVYLLCEVGTHTGRWNGEIGKKIWIKF